MKKYTLNTYVYAFASITWVTLNVINSRFLADFLIDASILALLITFITFTAAIITLVATIKILYDILRWNIPYKFFFLLIALLVNIIPFFFFIPELALYIFIQQKYLNKTA